MDSSGKKVLGTHYSKEEAKDQLAAIEISKKKQKQMKESQNLLNNSMTNLTEYYKNICEQLKAEILILEKKVKEEKSKKAKKGDKADKDYDGDGKVESKKDEYFGSRDKAIKKAMAKKKGKELNEAVTPIYDPKQDSAGLHPLLWTKETWAKDASKARAFLDAKKSKDGKNVQRSALDITTQAQADSPDSPLDVNNQIGTVNLDHARKFAEELKQKSDAAKFRDSFGSKKSVRAGLDSGASRSIDSIMTRIGDKAPDVFSDTKRTGGSYISRGSEAIGRVSNPDFSDASYVGGLMSMVKMSGGQFQKIGTDYSGKPYDIYSGKDGEPTAEDLLNPNAREYFVRDLARALVGGREPDWGGGGKGRRIKGLFREDIDVQKAMNAIGGNSGLILPDIRDNGAVKNNSLVEATAKRLGKKQKVLKEGEESESLAPALPAHVEKMLLPFMNPQLERLIQRHQDLPNRDLEIGTDIPNLDDHHSDVKNAMEVMQKHGLTTHPLYHSMDAVRLALRDAISAQSARKDRYGQSLTGRSSMDRGV